MFYFSAFISQLTVLLFLTSVCLLDVDAGRNLSRYTNDLSNILPCADVQLMEACARTMAHLGLQSGMTEYISRVLKRALNEWLRDEKTEYTRHCATYVLREFALQTPTMFYQMVTNFFECIPCGLRDSKVRYYRKILSWKNKRTICLHFFSSNVNN